MTIQNQLYNFLDYKGIPTNLTKLLLSYLKFTSLQLCSHSYVPYYLCKKLLFFKFQNKCTKPPPTPSLLLSSMLKNIFNLPTCFKNTLYNIHETTLIAKLLSLQRISPKCVSQSCVPSALQLFFYFQTWTS